MALPMATKTFKCPRWVAAGVNENATREGISDGEWIRRKLIEALETEGFTAEDYDFFTNTVK